jgi:hypothetical protein
VDLHQDQRRELLGRELAAAHLELHDAVRVSVTGQGTLRGPLDVGEAAAHEALDARTEVCAGSIERELARLAADDAPSRPAKYRALGT